MKLIHKFCLYVALVLAVDTVLFGQAPPPANVSVLRVEEKEIAEFISLVGEIVPSRESGINPEVSGKVEVIHFREGDRVKQGDVLLTLNQSQVSLEIKMAESETEVLKLEVARTEDYLNRRENLYKNGLISEEEQFNKNQELQILKQKLDILEAKRAILKDNIEKHTVKAPFDGVILQKTVEVGEWVNPATVLFRLGDMYTVHALFTVPEKHFNALDQKAAVKIIIDAIHSEPVSGTVYSLVPFALKSGKAMPIKVLIDNSKQNIAAGMYCQGQFSLTRTHKAVLVPKDAITYQGGSSFVMIVEEGTVKQVKVELLSAYDDLIEIKGLVYAGQQVVVEGNERVRAGQPVNIVAS